MRVRRSVSDRVPGLACAGPEYGVCVSEKTHDLGGSRQLDAIVIGAHVDARGRSRQRLAGGITAKADVGLASEIW